MTNSSLGIYFGPKSINLVETTNKKILNNIQIQRSLFAPSDLEPQVSDEVKIVALFNEEFRKNKIEVKEASICLSGKDLIIRTFEIPQLPQEELSNGVNFEVKKYIPFKVEDLVADFQSVTDKAARRNQVLYVGIKKETLEKYFSIASQLNIKVNTIEHSVFSLLRFLKLTNFNNRGVVAVFNVDYLEEDEANFIILENGFPLFSRDIVISGGPEEMHRQDSTPGMLLEKLKTEIRISLDYYNRTFLAKKISKIYLITNNDLRPDLETFFKEMSLSVNSIDISKYVPRNQVYSLGMVKGCGCALSKTIKSELKINLLAARVKIKGHKEPGLGFDIAALFAGFKVDTRIIAIGLFICLFAFAFGIYRKVPAQRTLTQVIEESPKVANVLPEASLNDLETLNSELNKQRKVFNNLISNQPYLTEVLDVLPKVVPDQMRLISITYSNKSETSAELQLQGMVDTGDSDQELKLINSFTMLLKDDPVFKKHFRNIGLLNIGHIDKVAGTNFTISCKK